jgi:HEAT repeat protein
MELPVSGQDKRKVCKACGHEKPLDAFCGHAYTADRLHPYCRDCHSANISSAKQASLARRQNYISSFRRRQAELAAFLAGEKKKEEALQRQLQQYHDNITDLEVRLDEINLHMRELGIIDQDEM